MNTEPSATAPPLGGQPPPSTRLRTFVRSTVASVVTTGLDFATLVGLVELLGVGYVLATTLGTVVGSLTNFLANRYWAFEAGGARLGGQVWRFLVVQAVGTGLQTLGVWLFTRFGGVPYVWSKTLVTALVYLVWTYPMNRVFVFPGAKGAAPATVESTAVGG